MKFGWKIAFYIARAVLPYFIFSWLLLSVILFVQQASRFADIFFSANIPASLVWQLTAALIPNVIAFTCPMAVLVGVIIGLSKMQGDSELVAIRAAGVGNMQITLPMLVLGTALSIFAFLVNLYGVPFASTAVRAIAMRAAILKLESPIEPGVFNTEVAGFTIYVKGGDIESGRWQNIFIHTEDPATGDVRLITSSGGRIDTTDEASELVLNDASATSFNTKRGDSKFVSEKIGEVRFAIKTRRGELVEKLSNTNVTADEMGLGDLSRSAGKLEGTERKEAEILFLRRILLSIAPLIFSLLGTVLVLRFSRGGKGFGIFIALVSLVGFYMTAFLGEQIARSGSVSVLVAPAVPIIASAIAIAWFSFVARSGTISAVETNLRRLQGRFAGDRSRTAQRSNFLVDITTGIRDLELATNLVRYFALTLGFLAAVFLIFTAFEMWRFVGRTERGVVLLLQYLAYLLPFIYLQLAPSAAMIAVLATYVIKSRQNEIVTWTAAGQSVYRLLFPAFGLMLILGVLNVAVQEFIAPPANLVQDELRNKLRSRGAVKSESRYWVADRDRIISFTINPPASDNAVAGAVDQVKAPIRGITIYDFSGSKAELQTMYQAESGRWENGRISLEGTVKRHSFAAGRITTETMSGVTLDENANPFLEIMKKPSQLNIADTRRQIENSESEVEKRSFAVALEKKYSTLFLPFVISLFTAPFALSLSRKGKATTVGYAIGLWLVFMGVTAFFEQFGLNGSLPPSVAVWSPLVLFGLIGIYLLTRVKT